MRSTDRAACLQVAAIHMAEIHHGVLPLLGAAFLARLYRELAGAPRSGVWAVAEEDRMVGFLAGCADAGATYRRILRRAALPLGARLAARLAGSPLLGRRVLSLLRYARREPEAREAAAGRGGEGSAPRAHAELLAIAVAAGHQGRGAGRRLVEAFEAAMREWGVDRYWVSTNAAEPASNRFYRSLGFVPAGTVAHHALTLQQYRKELAPLRRIP